LALASLTGGDRSIGIVRWRTKTTEFFLFDLTLKNSRCKRDDLSHINIKLNLKSRDTFSKMMLRKTKTRQCSQYVWCAGNITVQFEETKSW
jgi:hypothetical protein